jgi:hypothetical protein
MSARWALLIVLLLAAVGARADLGIQKSYTPVVPVGPLADEHATSTYQEEPMGPTRKLDSTSDTDQEVIFDKRARNFRAEEINQIELDEDEP